MQIKVTKEVDGGMSALELIHGDETQEWQVPAYKTIKSTDVHSTFANINGYLSSLPVERQQVIYDTYTNIFETLETVSDTLRLHVALQKHTKKLYEQVSFDELKTWVRFQGRVGVPADLKRDYDGVNSVLTQRLTYLHDDYYDLAILSALFKLMVPVFGEYIRRMIKEVGSRFKEHYAFSLISRSNLVNLPAFIRLRDYVEAITQNEERKKPSDFRKNSAVFGGLGTEELPDWLLSRAVVRRLCVHEESLGENIVARVYRTVGSHMDALDKTFNGRVNEKRLFGSGSEEDNVSVAENYKVKQEISDGDLAVLSIYTEEMYGMASRVDPTCPLDKVTLCGKASESNAQLNIQQHHITLTQWVLSKTAASHSTDNAKVKVVSPRGIPSLTKPSLLKAMAVTQAMLWHWGFEELALLMMAEPHPESSMAAGTATTRLGKKHTEMFFEMYPHYQPVSKSAHSLRNVNVACRAIDTLSLNMVENDWVAMGPKPLLDAFGLGQHEAHVVSAEIRQLLGDLLLKIKDPSVV